MCAREGMRCVVGGCEMYACEGVRCVHVRGCEMCACERV